MEMVGAPDCFGTVSHAPGYPDLDRWSPGDVDELIAVYDGARNIWFPCQDANLNVTAYMNWAGTVYRVLPAGMRDRD